MKMMRKLEGNISDERLEASGMPYMERIIFQGYDMY